MMLPQFEFNPSMPTTHPNLFQHQQDPGLKEDLDRADLLKQQLANHYYPQQTEANIQKTKLANELYKEIEQAKMKKMAQGGNRGNGGNFDLIKGMAQADKLLNPLSASTQKEAVHLAGEKAATDTITDMITPVLAQYSQQFAGFNPELLYDSWTGKNPEKIGEHLGAQVLHALKNEGLAKLFAGGRPTQQMVNKATVTTLNQLGIRTPEAVQERAMRFVQEGIARAFEARENAIKETSFKLQKEGYSTIAEGLDALDPNDPKVQKLKAAFGALSGVAKKKKNPQPTSGGNNFVDAYGTVDL